MILPNDIFRKCKEQSNKRLTIATLKKIMPKELMIQIITYKQNIPNVQMIPIKTFTKFTPKNCFVKNWNTISSEFTIANRNAKTPKKLAEQSTTPTRTDNREP